MVVGLKWWRSHKHTYAIAFRNDRANNIRAWHRTTLRSNIKWDARYYIHKYICARNGLTGVRYGNASRGKVFYYNWVYRSPARSRGVVVFCSHRIVTPKYISFKFDDSTDFSLDVLSLTFVSIIIIRIFMCGNSSRRTAEITSKYRNGKGYYKYNVFFRGHLALSAHCTVPLWCWQVMGVANYATIG